MSEHEIEKLWTEIRRLREDIRGPDGIIARVDHLYDLRDEDLMDEHARETAAVEERAGGADFDAMQMQEIDELHNFATQLFARRVSKGWTYEDLSKRSSIATESIATFEAGHRGPAFSVLVSLAHALGCSVRDLLTGEESETNSPSDATATHTAATPSDADGRKGVSNMRENITEPATPEAGEMPEAVRKSMQESIENLRRRYEIYWKERAKQAERERDRWAENHEIVTRAYNECFADVERLEAQIDRMHHRADEVYAATPVVTEEAVEAGATAWMEYVGSEQSGTDKAHMECVKVILTAAIPHLTPDSPPSVEQMARELRAKILTNQDTEDHSEVMQILYDNLWSLYDSPRAESEGKEIDAGMVEAWEGWGEVADHVDGQATRSPEPSASDPWEITEEDVSRSLDLSHPGGSTSFSYGDLVYAKRFACEIRNRLRSRLSQPSAGREVSEEELEEAVNVAKEHMSEHAAPWEVVNGVLYTLGFTITPALESE